MFQRILVISVIFFCLSISSYAHTQEEGNYMINLINQIKKTVVFLGRTSAEGNIQFYATGFLIKIQNYFHLVTAKHVVIDLRTGQPKDRSMQAFFNSKEGGIVSRSIDEIKLQAPVDWMFHPNKDVDVAIIPFGLDPHRDDVLTISDNLFLSTDRLYELYDIFFLSYQPGIKPHNKITPIIRTGNISLLNDDNTFYIDAAAFPGNSGSPVFLKPSPIRFDSGSISIGGDQLGGKFIGIIGEYVPYQEYAISTQTGRLRAVFEENTGLSKVWSVLFIKEIIKSDKFKEQINKLSKK
jgi:V8-like Glu-specific endopeptidase